MTANRYVAPFYYPPSTSSQYPGPIPSGQIRLYKDDNWSSTSLTIDTNSSKYPQGYPFSFSGTGLQDSATWIAFNLPVGTVCTLLQNVVTNQPKNPYDFSGAGVCVDLIGNGQVQTIDLKAYGANDLLSGGIWRRVNTSEGWFQLFKDTECSGTYATIFLDEWPTATANSIAGWWLNDQASSINFPCLTPVQTLKLIDNADGSGEAVALGASNPFGTWAISATESLVSRGMNDRVSAFQYDVIQPKDADIDSVTTQFSAPIPGGNTFDTSISGTNATSTEVQVQMMLAQSQTYSVSTTTTLEYSMGGSVSSTVSATAGVPDEASVSASTTTSLSWNATSSSSNTSSSSQTFELQQTVTFTAPAFSTYSATASVSIGEIPLTTITTTGRYYYDENLPGSVFDEVRGWYVLTTPVSINLSGGVGTQVTFTAKSTPTNR